MSAKTPQWVFVYRNRKETHWTQNSFGKKYNFSFKQAKMLIFSKDMQKQRNVLLHGNKNISLKYNSGFFASVYKYIDFIKRFN